MPKELKFIHITKCAGSSIEEIGKKHGLQWGKYDTEYSNVDGGWHTIFPSIHPVSIEKYDWFMVVRNPYTRILSEYAWELKEYSIPKHTKEQMNAFLMDRIKNRDRRGWHYTEQSAYFHPSKTIHILHFENLQHEFHALMRRYNKPHIRLDMQENVTKKTFTEKDFSKELLDLIHTVYHTDFERFHYKKYLEQPAKPKPVKRKVFPKPTEPCKQQTCTYFRHPDPNNNGGRFCCLYCKENRGHSPSCTSNDA
jgi:hypothetical protein